MGQYNWAQGKWMIAKAVREMGTLPDRRFDIRSVRLRVAILISLFSLRLNARHSLTLFSLFASVPWPRSKSGDAAQPRCCLRAMYF